MDLEKLKTLPVLKDGQWYIYVLQNSDNYVKVGRTTNLYQRIKSLSGSNTGGSTITKCFYSAPTYLYSLETTVHIHFSKYRAEGEWFIGVSFEEVSSYLNDLLTCESYEKCNEERKKFVLAKEAELTSFADFLEEYPYSIKKKGVLIPCKDKRGLNYD